MSRGNKLQLFIALILLCVSMLLSGCNEKVTTIRVLTEAQTHKSITSNGQFDLVVKQFQKKYENVTVVVERLPEDSKSREIALEQLRTEIMAGKGPDIFLLPTNTEQCMLMRSETPRDLEILFPDVNQAMHNGLFMDISALYDADTELDKDSLLTTVMDAGVVGDARYALPLRYDIPVIYLDIARLEEAGIDLSIYQQDIITLLDDVTGYGLDWLAAGADNMDLGEHILNYFPNVIDYENQKVSITKEELITFLNSYCACKEVQGTVWGIRPFAPAAALWDDTAFFWAMGDEYQNGTSIGSMCNVISNIVVSQASNIEVIPLPLTATDGSVIAEVTFYGAIGTNCKKPELAYELLRPMLQEDAQWQNTEVKTITNINAVSEGWPVRAKGAAYRIYRNHYKYTYVGEISASTNVKKAVLRGCNVYDEDIEALLKVDKARFPIPLEREFGNRVKGLYNRFSGIDGSKIDTVVDEFLRELEWHVGEG